MTNLLDKWAELEPDRCQKRDIPGIYNIIYLGERVDINADGCDHVIQIAVQEAAKSRKLYTSLTIYDREYCTAICHDAISTYVGMDYLPNPGEALLSAYLEYLELRYDGSPCVD